MVELPKLQGLEYEFIVFDEAADMFDWDKPTWDQPFTGEPQWMRNKKREEDREWFRLREEIDRKLQGFPRDFQRMVFEAMDCAQREGMPARIFATNNMGRLEREFRTPTTPIIRQTPTYTKREIEPLPEFFCLHFIGGPKTGTEEFWPYRANANIIEQGKTFVIALPRDLAPTIDENNIVTVHKGEQYIYKSTFIPRNETPFSDAQVVICLFQG